MPATGSIVQVGHEPDATITDELNHFERELIGPNVDKL